MKRLPYLNEIPVSHRGVEVFAGYNHNLRIGDGEFYEMHNMTSDFYPVLSPRGARGVYYDSGRTAEEFVNASITPVGAIKAKGELCYVDYDGITIGGKTTIQAYFSHGEKRLVSMGAYLIVLPDGYYVNTIDTREHGYIGEFSLAKGVRFTSAHASGAPLEPLLATEDEVVVREYIGKGGEAVAYWYNTADKKTYKCSFEAAEGGGTVFAKEEIKRHTRIDSDNIANRRYVGEAISFTRGSDPWLKEFDGIKTVSACGDAVTTQYLVVDAELEIDVISCNLTSADFYDTDGTYYISDATREKISQTGVYIPTSVPNMTMKSVFAKLPTLDYVCERGNRLWGCRYGTSDTGTEVNEIYASVQGNFERWNKFEGIADDAYVMSVGSDGPFTGCTAFGDCTIFFKENCFHKVYGKIPSEFYSVDVDAPGVESGSDRSIATVDGVLYYKSISGVFAYDGSLPVNVSSALGGEYYNSAVACAFSGKYYISMRNGEGAWELLVYDARRKMWHKEDNMRLYGCDSMGDELYLSNGVKIYTVRGTGDPDKGAVTWECESGLIGTEDASRKYISKLNVRMSLPPESRVEFFARYDSAKTPELIGRTQGRGLQTFTLPMRVRRCDHMSLIIRGVGEAKVYSIIKSVEEGSDVI